MTQGRSPQQKPSAPLAIRAASLQTLAQETLDLLVIGGGIVGAGVVRDAALRGLNAGLVEQYDFAFGTSSRSSRLLHGGLRYLAQGRLGLVREASLEKQILHTIAPHLAEPLPIIFPAFQEAQWPLWQMRIGVKIYDFLCGGKNLGKSGSLSRDQTIHQIPCLSQEGLKGAVRYFDAFTNDARLVLDTLRSAVKSGATVLNYLKFTDSTRESSHWTCELEDNESGQKVRVRARAIVNATGPWAEGLAHSQVKLRLTKGIHLVIERQRLPIPEAIAITQGKRLLFVIPWGQRLIIGTTDTDYSGSLDDVHPDTEDVRYVLKTINRFFPKAPLTESDIISSWAGVRPLIASPEHAPSDATRSHQLLNPEPGWWDLAGGKLTTYRLMAEQTLGQVIRWLKKTSYSKMEQEYAHCRTAEEPLLARKETEGVSGVLPPKFEREVLNHYCSQEWALHLDDVMVRRAGWQQYFGDLQSKAEQVAQWMAELLHWTSDYQFSELKRYRQSLEIHTPNVPIAD